MTERRERPLAVAIVDPLAARSRRLSASIRQDGRFRLQGVRHSLTEAYNEVESDQPDIVVVGSELLAAPEYPMFQALISVLGLRAMAVSSDPSVPVGGDDDIRMAHSAEIDAAGGMAGFLARELGLEAAAAAAPRRPAEVDEDRLVVIGASTGGIEALITVLSSFPRDCPPTMVVQHIGAEFVPGLVQRLDRHCAARVIEAVSGMDLQPGLVMVAPGRREHLTVGASGRRCRLVPGERFSGHLPSVDMLFDSAARLGTGVVGVLLTGMGRDGAEGLAAIRRAGGWTIGQDAATSTVYGMPRAAADLGAVAEQLPIGAIGPAILKVAQGRRRRVAS